MTMPYAHDHNWYNFVSLKAGKTYKYKQNKREILFKKIARSSNELHPHYELIVLFLSRIFTHKKVFLCNVVIMLYLQMCRLMFSFDVMSEDQSLLFYSL